MKSIRKLALAAASACVLAVSAPVSNAAVIQLGFILDDSGSIGSSNWNIIRSGLANAILNKIPVGGTDTYEISVLTFSTNVNQTINSYVVADAADRTAVANLVANLTYFGGNTNFQAAFAGMQTLLTDSVGSGAHASQYTTAANALHSYVNFATDGVPNTIGTTSTSSASQSTAEAAGVTARNALITAGIDNISIEGIGAGINTTYLQGSICYPTPCDTTAPFNFDAQGFYIGVADAQGYADAIANKITIVTGGTTPEPGTLALLGLGLAGLAASRRRKQ